MTGIAVAAALAALAFGGLQRYRAARARKELENARRAEADAREQARRANRARDGFFDVTTHELRSPLAAILGYQELIRDGAYATLDDAAEPVERIGRSAQHLLHLIDGVVELSRARGGTLEPDLEPVSLQDLAASVATAFTTSARERRIQPAVTLPDAHTTILTDPERVLRALDLVITSAVKHPAGDRLSLGIRLNGDRLHVDIHETAIHTHAESDDPALRLGIRLAIARATARLLGGSLELDEDESGVIHGISFRIHVPPPGSEQTL
ncbi:MAG TPA: HAMP domain-containing sensor histidine kinase [Longimicrobiales bacterium]|nr:HAMP domain-containing sensor histidine kinase [Longimicrobiales bacterium]